LRLRGWFRNQNHPVFLHSIVCVAAMTRFYIASMEIDESKPLSIKDWSLDDRPREKLVQKGTMSLSDAELIAILIGSGTANMNAVESRKKLMQHVENSLAELSRLSVKDLMRVRGIGEVRAITIVAALELGRRRKDLDTIEKAKIGSSKDAFDQLETELMDLPTREFWVLLVNRLTA